MIIDQRLVKVIKQIIIDELSCRLVHEVRPRTTFVTPEQTHRLLVLSELVLGNVAIERFASHNLRNLAKLVVVIFSAEKRSAVEHNSEKHARQRPDVERVIVLLSSNPPRSTTVSFVRSSGPL